MDSLTVLEASCQKSRCWQDHVLSEGARGGSSLASSHLLMVAGSLWHFLACRFITDISDSVFTWLLPWVFVLRLPSSCKDTSHWIRVHPDPVWPHLNLITSPKTLFLNRFLSTGSEAMAYLWREDSSTQLITVPYCSELFWASPFLSPDLVP